MTQKPCDSTPSGTLNLLRKFSSATTAVSSTICASSKWARSRANSSSLARWPVMVMASAHQSAPPAPRLLDGGRELLGRLEDGRAVGKDLRGVEETAEELALLGEELFEDGIAASVLYLAHSR